MSFLVSTWRTIYRKELDLKEELFWRHVVSDVLKPNSEVELRKTGNAMKPKLESFKNKMMSAYFFINSLWLVITFSLALVFEDVKFSVHDKEGNVILVSIIDNVLLRF